MTDKSKEKRVYSKMAFTHDDEEKIISFVKLNPELYNPKHANYKNKEHKDRLWNNFAISLENSKSGWPLKTAFTYILLFKKKFFFQHCIDFL